MDSPFSRLIKILSLERKQGFRNKAVIGGLDKFASRWEVEARGQADNPAAVDEIVALLLGYPAVEDLAARERIVEQIVRRARAATPDVAGPEWAPPRPQAVNQAPAELRPERTTETSLPALTKPAFCTGEAPACPEPVAGRSAAAPDKSPSDRPAQAPAAYRLGGAPPDVAPPLPRLPRPQPVENATISAPPAGSARGISTEEPQPRPAAARMRAESAPDPEALTDPWATLPAARRPATEAPVAASEPSRPARPAPGLAAPVIRLPGIGPSFADKLAKLGVRTVRDLLYLLPRRYDDYSSLRTIDRLVYGEEATVIATVWKLSSRIIGENRKMISAIVGDGTGEMEMTWFNPYVERRLRAGHAYAFSGKIDSYRGRLLIRNPEFEPLERRQVHTGRLVPVYPLTEGITARWLRVVLNRALEAWAGALPDFLPESVRREMGLMTLAEALTQIHFPDNAERLKAAHRRLSFDEFLLLQLGVLGQRQRYLSQPARALAANSRVLAPFLASLPFTMTAAQQRALADITADLQRPQPMIRLLQGDVGSGKTAVAAAALWVAVANAAQGAIVAPTEILAEQHARSFTRQFANLHHPGAGRPVRVGLFTGHLRGSERNEALAALAAGDIDIAVGTHALMQEDVAFHNLALAVVDEQHRFGVEQRAALRQKGAQPHLLVMSATPIPRSLALTLYGDLDVSVMDEMPAGRAPIKTKWMASTQREHAYAFIRRQIEAGRQAFIIYPLVEESTSRAAPAVGGDVRAAVAEHARLQSAIFPDLRLGLLHGRLKSEEKDAVMAAFAAGELQILVATSVVEVGIDVPNATVMLVEGAERFGLAQLHQFRGRVGRGEHPSYCLLVSDAQEGESVKRLRALETINNGFALAQIDLDLRGPGDFFGTRQSGLPPLHTAQLGDLRTLEAARGAAQKLFASDPSLSHPEHAGLAQQVAALWRGAGDVS